MECNAELEKAEAQLRENFHDERRTREQRRRLSWSWTDNIIGVAAILHFVVAAVWAAAFAVLTLLRVSGKDVPGWAWVSSLPAAIASLGVGLALVRVLDLTARRPARATEAAAGPDSPTARSSERVDARFDTMARGYRVGASWSCQRLTARQLFGLAGSRMAW